METIYIREKRRTKKRIRIVSKTRFVVFMIIVILALGLLLGSILKLDKAYSTTYDKWKQITVKTGDTLWGIAKANNPKNEDTRKVVYDIMKYNNMKKANIIAGQTLRIPIND